MKTTLFLSYVCVLQISLCHIKNYTGYKLYHVKPSVNQYEKLKHLNEEEGYDFWTQYHDRSIEILVAPFKQREFQSLLDKLGVEAELKVEDLYKHFVKVQMAEKKKQRSEPGMSPFDQYLDYQQMCNYTQSLQEKYPGIINVSSFGKSYEGRDLQVVRVTRCKNHCPVMLIEAGTHAREWIGPATALYIIHQLVENNTNNNLVNGLDWRIIFLLNPDGYEYSRNHDHVWRKTRSKQENGCFGVDGNRNYDIHWAEVGAVTTKPCSSTYPGHEPFSENETRALKNYVLGLKGKAKFYLSLHSYGNYILLPWGYTSEKPDDIELLKDLAEIVGDSFSKNNTYFIGSPPELLYAAGGSSQDYMKAVLDIKYSFTMELTKTEWGFFIPSTHILSIMPEVYIAISEFAKGMLNTYPN
ncbi:hypothetical protein L9F63_012622 [Diploptera punctata]|uniref:Peptidase M14 domain-containing protein n=1 Tax=Diploptera punctata TaxID=6984 RepID=A0AAD8ACA1_DIPPU|nr:hypothetical protein L9F63_012622 [Diploptera punctata]